MENQNTPLDLTNQYINKIANENAKKPNPPQAMVITHGCQMNARDSEKLKGMLVAMGYTICQEESAADLVIFNTCCVRENAENKLYGNLGRFKEQKLKNPGFKLALCGCMMQQDIVVEKIKASYRYVDIIFGTYNMHRFAELLQSNADSGSMIIDIWQDAKEIVEDLPSLRQYPYKASVNIMYGCDNYCTFCIVPYVRGAERSRQPDDILAEVRGLVDSGVKEIVLLGQNVDSYGKGLNVDFAQLLHMIADVNGLWRIRFTSNHPKDICDNLINAMAQLDKVCKHLHLPFQAGSDKILKAMNRGYTKAEYLELISRIKAKIPNIAITTDIMVGFPGEDDEDFGHTLDIVRQARFAGAFTFLYSRRVGTLADKMPNQVPKDIMKARFDILLKEVNQITAEAAMAKEGSIVKVMTEEITDAGILSGRADDNTLVHFNGPKELLGKLVDVRITQAKTFYLNGELI